MNQILVLLGVLALVLVFIVAIYNSLLALKNRVMEAWSGIDVQLKRRASLIPNLVETVKGYASHEKELLERVTEARASLMNAKTPKESAEADNMLTGALKSLFAVAEAYPDLKASDNFKSLQKDLADTEDKVAYSRQFYNANVTEFNTRIMVFPNVIIANMFNFKPFDFFRAEEEDRKDVKVQF